VISDVAKRIRARLRGGDVLGRFSGNKFGLILKNCTVDDMNVAAERFLATIRNEVVPTKSGPVSVTASIGAVSVPRYARNTGEAINRAHETLDGAKRRRSGSFSLWRPNVERDAQRRVNIRVTDEIVTALNERRIVMAFEPVVEAGSRDTAFYECLVRMEQADGQVLLAPDIVPVAERLGDRNLARDVGQALGENPVPVIVPCHRVLAAGGKMGGFSAPGGIVTKLRLLTIEGAQPNGPTLFDRLPLQAPRRRA